MQAKEGLGWSFANSWNQLFLVWLPDFHFLFQLSWASIDILIDIILGRGGGNREAREVMYLVASVCPSAHLCVCQQKAITLKFRVKGDRYQSKILSVWL